MKVLVSKVVDHERGAMTCAPIGCPSVYGKDYLNLLQTQVQKQHAAKAYLLAIRDEKTEKMYIT